MAKGLAVLLAIVLGLCLAANAARSPLLGDAALDCTVNQRRVYSYQALINAFGGSSNEFDPNNDDAERITLTAEVGITCLYHIKQASGSFLYFFELDMRNVVMTASAHSSKDGWKTSETEIDRSSNETQASSGELLDKDFAKFTSFVSTSNGKLVSVVMSKKETPLAKSVKKGIISQLQIKLNGDSSREEKDALGSHKTHYRKEILNDGSVVIKKQFTEADLEAKDRKVDPYAMRRRDMRLKSQTDVVLNKEGQFESVFKEENVAFGVDSTKTHKVFSINSNVPWDKKNHWDNQEKDGSGGYMSARGWSELQYLRSEEGEYQYKSYIALPSENTIQALSDSETKGLSRSQILAQVKILNDEYQFESLETKELDEYSRKMRAQYLRENFDINIKLNDLLLLLLTGSNEEKNKDEQSVTILASKITEYVKALPQESLNSLMEAFSHVKSAYGLHNSGAVDFMKLIQTFLVSCQTKEAQKLLVTKTVASDSIELIQHAIFRTLALSKPSNKVRNWLKDVMINYQPATSSNSTQMSDEEIVASSTRLNAYLALADSASRLSKKRAMPIVNDVLHNLQSAKSLEEFLLHLNAASNAGHRIPLSILTKLILLKSNINIDNINSLTKLKLTAIQALGKRTASKKDNARVTALIHKIVHSKKFAPELKAEAINVQADREYALESEDSLDFLGDLLLDATMQRIERRVSKFAPHVINDRVEPEVKAAIVKYLLTIKTQRAGDILATAIYYRDPLVLTLMGFKQKQPEMQVLSEADSFVHSEAHFYAQLDDDSDLIHPMSQADAKFFKKVWNGIKKVGKGIAKGVKNVTKAIGKGVKNAAKAVGNAAKKVGKAVGTAAKKVGQAVGKAAKAVGKAVKKVGEGIATVAKNVVRTVRDVTRIWKKATFGAQTCFSAGGKQLCLYDKDMISFVSQQGDLSDMSMNKHFSWERLIGGEKLHAYVGVVGFAGTNFNCRAPPATFKYSVFGRANVKAHLFGRDVNLITASFENGYQSGRLNDKFYLKIFNTVMINRGLLNKEFQACQSKSKQLAHKEYPNLLSFRTMLVIVIVPVEFGVSATASMDLSLEYDICVDNLAAAVRLVPSATLGASGHAAVSILIAKAGLSLDASVNYSLYPELQVEGLRCRLCASLIQSTKPITISVNGFADINLVIFKKHVKKRIFGFSAPASKSTVARECLSLPVKSNALQDKEVLVFQG